MEEEANIRFGIFHGDIYELDNTTVDKKVFIDIRRESLNPPRPNEPTHTFSKVIFNKDIVIGIDESSNEEIVLEFDGCFIDCLDFKDLESRNFSVFFRNCIVNLVRLDNSNLRHVSVFNSFGGFYFNHLRSIEITYNEEHIFLRKWEALLSLFTHNEIISKKASFTISDCIKTKVSGIQSRKKSNVQNERQIGWLSNINNLTYNTTESREYQFKIQLSEEEKKLLFINLNFQGNMENVQRIKINGIILNSLSISGNQLGDFLVEDCEIKNIYLRNFYPKEKFELYKIGSPNELGKFEIFNCNLSKVIFNSVMLKDYQLSFYKSSFVDTQFTSTIFPKLEGIISVENIHYPNKKAELSLYNRNMYELFLELNLAFEKRGNVVEAKKMKSVAYYYLSKSDDLSFWNEKWVIGINRFTNKNGVSVLRPFALIILSLIVLQYLNVIAFSSIEIKLSDFETMKKIAAENIKFITTLANPAHKISSLAPPDEITDATYFVSFFSRIIVGYLYFQFIFAFRRFGK